MCDSPGATFVSSAVRRSRPWGGQHHLRPRDRRVLDSACFNPAGHWAFLSGNAVMPFNKIPQPSGSCFSSYSGITTDWSLGNVSGTASGFCDRLRNGARHAARFLGGRRSRTQPRRRQRPGQRPGVRYVDGPANGTISAAGVSWYAQSAQRRSNKFTLTLGKSTLASGTVAFNSVMGTTATIVSPSPAAERFRSRRAMW